MLDSPARSVSCEAAPPAIVAWLWLCCLLVFAMVVLGGAVRLTGSGLSMVDWQPLRGIIPPLDEAHWQQAFARYRQFPEFQQVNPDMTLAGFRFIFWMEYAHRLLGRVLGLVFLLPFLFFLWRRMVPSAAVGRLWILFLLGGLQGLLGWYMVQSGLVDDPRVSHYRLAMHFMLAVLLYAYLLRVVVGLRPQWHAAHDKQVTATRIGLIALAALLVVMTSGALVAGTQAGYGYNTWPKMGGQWLPPQLLVMRPWWLNFVENTVAIQFTHRWLAMLALVAVVGFAAGLLYTAERRRAFLPFLLLVAAFAQVALGITTLLLQIPPALGVAHQAGALVLLTLVVLALAQRLPPLASASD